LGFPKEQRVTLNRTLPPILGSPGSLQILPLQLPGTGRIGC
jgi:hypothetical protein